MKKILLFAFTLCLLCNIGQAEIIFQNGHFTQIEKTKKQKEPDPQTPYPYKYKGVYYPTYISRNGRVYSIVPKKDGGTKKVYMPKEDSRRIAAEMGIEFKENIEPFK